MTKFETIKKPLGRVLRVIYKDRSKFKFIFNPKNVITAEKLEQAAGNHMFSESYKILDITKIEGHKIRNYFNCVAGNGKQYIIDLHETFPEIMDSENPKYMEDVNKYRKSLGLEKINY